MKNNINYYSRDEINKIIESDSKLVTISTGEESYIGKYEDLPDIIVGLNEQLGNTDMEIWYYDDPFCDDIITTFGFFLNKCRPEVRSDIIDRLVKLQTGDEEVKDFKLIDTETLSNVLYEKNEKEIER